MRRHFALLDGLRGIAALAVVGSHFQIASGIPLHMRHAGVAVDFFFILSGVVIGQAYEARLVGGLGWLGYMRIRVGRLYPAIFGALVAAVAIALAAGDPLDPAMLLPFLLLPTLTGPAVGGGELFPLDGPMWSLFWELAVNAAHGALTRWLTTPRLAVLVAIAAAGLIATSAHFGSLDVGWNRATAWGAAPRVVFGFGAGLLLLRADRRGWRAPAVPWWLICAVLGLCLVRPFDRFVPDGVADPVTVLIVMPALVALAMRDEPPPAVTRVALWAGALSYPLYAVHAPLLSGFAQLLDDAPDAVRPAGWWAALVAVLILAGLFERFYDRPIRAALRARLTPPPRRRPPRPPPPPDGRDGSPGSGSPPCG